MRRVATALALIALAAATALAGVDSVPSGLAAAQTTTDYDDDDDRLIDVRTLAQLNAIRWDLNGDGDVSATDAANYLLAFPNRDTAAATRMGCPSGNCNGYELRADLDFDRNGDGSVNSSDAYPNTPAGANLHNWTPISQLNTEFKGNNRTISNLTMTTSGSVRQTGMFAINSGTITGVGLVDADITASRNATANVGSLVGANVGTVRSSYATGEIRHTGTGFTSYIGGLVGYNQVFSGSAGTIAASWARVNVSSSGLGSYIGGLIGSSAAGSTTIIASYAAGAVSATGSSSYAGGLIGQARYASISSSYAIGAVSETGTGGGSGGLIGQTRTPITIAASYWDTGTTGIADDADGDAPEGVTTSDLQSLTSYTGIFATWNANVDGQAGADDPWEFGQAMQYPRLKFGFDAGGQVAQGSLVMGTPGTNNDNPVVGQVARVCLLDGPTQRAAGTGGATYAPWQWYRSTDGANWGNPITKSGPTYDYMPVSGDVGNYLRACVDVVSSTGAERVLGDDMVCVGPFAKVKASGGS